MGGAEVLWHENLANSLVLEQVFSRDVSLVVTNQRREPDGDRAGTLLCRALSKRGFKGRCILHTSDLNVVALVEAWLAGACFATDSLSETEAFLQSCVRAELSAAGG